MVELSNEEKEIIKERIKQANNTLMPTFIPQEQLNNEDERRRTIMDNEEKVEEDDEGKLSKKQVKTISDFSNGIAYTSMDDVHDILKKYSYYQDDNSLFKFKLNDTFILNNKVDFLKHIDTKLTKYLNEKKEDPDFIEEKDTCDIASKQTGFTPFLHQDLVKEYLNATSPYRGLLLYHGLGSGKTCTSIGIIEAMKQTKSKIFILTPASLAKNYKTQMKSCGSLLFRKDENWEYVRYPTDETRNQFINDIHKLTQLDMKYLNSKKGIYLRTKGVVNKPDELTDIQKEELNEQINRMIDARFNFISYNGINMKSWNTKYKNPKFGKHYNPFNNSTIIIDEGHNFVSRIINKLNINQSSVSTELYNHIIQAENCNVVVLSGTPLINYPSELGVMFNLISGCYTTFEFRCNHSNPKNVKFKRISKSIKRIKFNRSCKIYFKDKYFTNY